MHVYMCIYTLVYMDKFSEYPNNVVWINKNISEIKRQEERT